MTNALKRWWKSRRNEIIQTQESQGYAFAAAMLLKSQGHNDPRDWIASDADNHHPFDFGILQACIDYNRQCGDKLKDWPG